ncbi:hypothetical protein X777_12575 [Ooceraea biroi]|uniref:Uncharacterized protein n=1 Tax=Ooceraea biroi TaxID=2015173 RepID=A0A026VZJ2_OOCBI|nr:hypothetical protein X777_12575 [Ooceraea biroi]
MEEGRVSRYDSCKDKARISNNKVGGADTRKLQSDTMTYSRSLRMQPADSIGNTIPHDKAPASRCVLHRFYLSSREKDLMDEKRRTASSGRMHVMT